MAAYADAVIVGSALVRTLLDAEDAGTARRPGRACRAAAGRRPRRGRSAGRRTATGHRQRRELHPEPARLGVSVTGRDRAPGGSGPSRWCSSGSARPGDRMHRPPTVGDARGDNDPAGYIGRHLAARAVRDARPVSLTDTSGQRYNLRDLAVQAGHAGVLRLHPLP